MNKEQLIKDYKSEQDEIMNDWPGDLKDYVRFNKERLEKEY